MALVYGSLPSFPVCVCLHVPCSVERTPNVSKEGEGGGASDGTEGTAQWGGDLHRRLNLASPDAHARSQPRPKICMQT